MPSGRVRDKPGTAFFVSRDAIAGGVRAGVHPRVGRHDAKGTARLSCSQARYPVGRGPAGAARAAAQSPPRLRASLGRVVLVHWVDQLGGPCGAGFRVIRGARKSCVLMRDNAKSCNSTTVVGRSLQSPVHAGRRRLQCRLLRRPVRLGGSFRWRGRAAVRYQWSARVALILGRCHFLWGRADPREARTELTLVSRRQAAQYCSFEISMSRSSERSRRSR